MLPAVGGVRSCLRFLVTSRMHSAYIPVTRMDLPTDRPFRHAASDSVNSVHTLE